MQSAWRSSDSLFESVDLGHGPAAMDYFDGDSRLHQIQAAACPAAKRAQVYRRDTAVAVAFRVGAAWIRSTGKGLDPRDESAASHHANDFTGCGAVDVMAGSAAELSDADHLVHVETLGRRFESRPRCRVPATAPKGMGLVGIRVRVQVQIL
jgi:hypothetical protein